MHWLSTNNSMKESSRQTATQHQNRKERRGREIRQEKLLQLQQLQVCLHILKMYLNKHLNLILNHKLNLKYNLPNHKNKIINTIKNPTKVNKKSANNRISNSNYSSNNNNRSKEVNLKIKRKKEEVMIKTS